MQKFDITVFRCQRQRACAFLIILGQYNGPPMKSARLLTLLIPFCLFAPPGILAQLSQKPELAPAAHKALAAVSGRIHLKGLEDKVDVLRDRWGVAHIYARNQHDLFFAQGVVAAQDRLFQMELWKRAGQGRLAEILGPSALPRDINARALRYRGNMKAEYESYSPDTLAILTAFTGGINAYIASLTAPGGPALPIEFQLAGFAPDAWHPEDCLNRMAAFSMTGNAWSELEHAQALTDFGVITAAKLFDFDPAVPLDPAPGLDLAGLSPELLKIWWAAIIASSSRRTHVKAATTGASPVRLRQAASHCWRMIPIASSACLHCATSSTSSLPVGT